MTSQAPGCLGLPRGYHLEMPRGSGGRHVLLGDLGAGHVGLCPGEAGHFCFTFSYVCVLDCVAGLFVSPRIHMMES